MLYIDVVFLKEQIHFFNVTYGQAVLLAFRYLLRIWLEVWWYIAK